MRRASKVLRFCASVLLLGLLFTAPILAQERGWIGVDLQDVSPARALELGFDRSSGTLITATRRGGSAERSGLLAGDIILEFDDQPLGDTKAAIQAIQTRPPGTAANVTVWRNKARHTVSLAIGKAPEVLGLYQQIEGLGRAGKHAEVAALADKLEASADALPGLSPNERAQAFEHVGYALQELSQYAKAEVFRRRVLEVREAQHGPSHSTVSLALSNLGDSVRRQKRYKKALDLYERALVIVEAAQGKDHPDHAWALSRSGDCYYYLSRYAEAAALYRRSLAIREKQYGSDHAMMARPVGDLGDALRMDGKYAEAAALYQRKLTIVEKEKGADHSDVGEVLNWLATSLRHNGQYAEAEQAAQRAVRLHTAAGLIEKAGWSRFELGANLRWQMKLEEASREFSAAKEILEAVLPAGDTGLAVVMFGQVQVLMEFARYAEAEGVARTMLALREKADGPNHSEVGRALEMVGYILQQLDRNEEAEPLYRRALAIRERTLGADHPELAGSLSGLAWVLYNRSQYEEAEALSRRSLAIRQRVLGPDHPDVAWSLATLSAIMRYTNRVAEAVPLTRQRLGILERSLGPDHPNVASALNSLGLLLERTDKTPEAVPLYERALGIRLKVFGDAHPDVAWNYNRLGLVAEMGNRWTEALGYFRKATAIVSRRALDIQRRDRTLYDEAEQTQHVFRNLVDAAYEVALLQPELGEDLLDEAFRAAQWRARTKTSEALLQMAARHGTGDSKLAALVREGQDLRTRWAAAERRQVEAAGRAAGPNEDAGRDFSAISKRLDEIAMEIARRQPAFADLAVAEPLDVQAARGHLRDGEALVFYLHTGSDTYVWALTQNAAFWQRLGLNRSHLDDAVDRLRCGLDRAAWHFGGEHCSKLVGPDRRPRAASAALPFDVQAAHDLYKDLIAPIADLTEARHLLIVPSGPLAQLPFQVLVSEPPVAAGADAYSSAAWLGHRQPISVLPAVSALKALRQDARTSNAAKPLISFANPVLDGPGGATSAPATAARAATSCASPTPPELLARAVGRSVPNPEAVFRGTTVDLANLRALPPLPETVAESCDLARSVGAAEADLWFAGRATEANLKSLSDAGELAKYKVLHFATHGLVSGGSDDLQDSLTEPALVFTPPPDGTTADDLVQDNGLLTASEVAALRLDADWVILSACNTAAGNAHGAEALSGLARAFLYAGARALLVSHWEVDSQAAVRLVTGAFAALEAEPGLGRAEALRRSITAHFGDAPEPHEVHPSYWAPFVVIGEGGR